MKKNLIIIICMILSINVFAQEAKDKHLAKLPAVEIQDLNGNAFNTKDIQNDGKPIIISLWATWCKPCIAELLAIADEYEDWVEETGVKLYAISIDDAKTSARVAPFVLAFREGSVVRRLGVHGPAGCQLRLQARHERQ